MPGHLVPGGIPARGADKWKECAVEHAAVLTGSAAGSRNAGVPAPAAGEPAPPPHRPG